MRWQARPICYQQNAAGFVRQLLQLEAPIWLDSCAHAQTAGRYDLITAAPKHTFVFNGSSYLEAEAFFNELRAAQTGQGIACGELKFNGLCGFLSYEFGLALHDLNQHTTLTTALPKAWFGLYQWAVIVDHQMQQAWFVYQASQLSAALQSQLLQWWQTSDTTRLKSVDSGFKLSKDFESNISYGQYQQALMAIEQHLQQGDSYQVNYSHTLSADYQGDAFDAYLMLRQQNPAEYAAFLRLPQADILSLSPELLVQANGSQLVTKPIKGTAKRTGNKATDASLKAQLAACPKNQAENLMIVDLLRNDLSKVSELDSVMVSEFLKLETLPSVYHLVSTIRSQLAKDNDYFDVLKALFPGGSITGAPKHRTMQLITEYEAQTRGIYCGSMGYLSSDFNMCFNIAIRTLTAADQTLYCPAGGGIVMDSQVHLEYSETLDKVRRITSSLQQCASFNELAGAQGVI